MPNFTYAFEALPSTQRDLLSMCLVFRDLGASFPCIRRFWISLAVEDEEVLDELVALRLLWDGAVSCCRNFIGFLLYISKGGVKFEVANRTFPIIFKFKSFILRWFGSRWGSLIC